MKRESDEASRADMGAIGLFLAIVILMLIALFFQDAKGEPIGSFTALLWGGATVVAFLLGLLSHSQFVIPFMRVPERWSSGLTLISRYYSSQASRYLRQLGQGGSSKPKRGKQQRRVRRVEPLKEEEPLRLPNNLHLVPRSFLQIRAGILSSHQALGIIKNGRFQRAVDPSFAMLYQKEGISHLIDLRPHLRSQGVKARTRDGISIETSVTIMFRVRQQPVDLLVDDTVHLCYPYDRDAIFDLLNATTIDDDHEPKPWTEVLCPQAAALLIDEISRCTLDQLFMADGAGSGVDEVTGEILKRLKRDKTWAGFDILSVSMGRLVVPEAVLAQRIAGWQAKWERAIVEKEAQRDADAVRRLKKARARAQIKIIGSITQNINVMRQTSDANLSEIIMLRMIEALEESINDSSVRALIPQQAITNLVMDASTQMQSLMKRPS